MTTIGAEATASATSDDSGAATRERLALVAALTCLCVLTAVGLARHPMWFDELQSWNIARVSGSVGDLVHNTRNEGHPILWFLTLFGLTRFTGNPVAMQVMQFGIVAAIYVVLLFRSPFPVPLRIAIAAGYYFTFEFAVLTRPYGLTTLLLLAAVDLLARRRPAWWGAAIVLVLVSFFNLVPAVLSMAVAAALGVTALQMRRPREGAAATPLDRRVLAVIIGVPVATAVAALSSFPSGDNGPGNRLFGEMFAPSVGDRVNEVLSAVWRSLVPIPTRDRAWNSNVLDALAAGRLISALLGLGLAVLILIALQHRPFARNLWVIGNLGLLGFFLVVYPPHQLHHIGFYMVLFVMCLWFAWRPPNLLSRQADPIDPQRPAPARRGAPEDRLLWSLSIFVAVAQVLAAAVVVPTWLSRPFSDSRANAEAIEAAGLSNAVVSGEDGRGTAIAAYLDANIYSAAYDGWIRFFPHDQREYDGSIGTTAAHVLDRAAALAGCRGQPVAVLLTEDPPEGRTDLVPLRVTGDAGIYRLEPPSNAGTDPRSGGCP